MQWDVKTFNEVNDYDVSDIIIRVMHEGDKNNHLVNIDIQRIIGKYRTINNKTIILYDIEIKYMVREGK